MGQNGGPYAKDSGTIVASYSSGDVGGRGDVGGLVGENYATILISYSTGAVQRHGSEAVGGLVGRQSLNNNDRTVYYSITNSYWSTTDTSWPFGVGSDDRNNNNTVDGDERNTVFGFSTSDLQAPHRLQRDLRELGQLRPGRQLWYRAALVLRHIQPTPVAEARGRELLPVGGDGRAVMRPIN